jgi:hypothetical protein
MVLLRHTFEVASEAALDSALICARQAMVDLVHASSRVGGLSDSTLLFVQREGFRTPEALRQHETGSTALNAAALVQVGTVARDSAASNASSSSEPWFREIGAAVTAGSLSVDAARAIRIGLGGPSDSDGAVAPGHLTRAAHVLVMAAALVDANELLRHARSLRDDLDEAGIVDRERTAFQERCVRRTRRPNGLTRYIVRSGYRVCRLLGRGLRHAYLPSPRKPAKVGASSGPGSHR